MSCPRSERRDEDWSVEAKNEPEVAIELDEDE